MPVAHTGAVVSERLLFDTDTGIGARANFGLIVLRTDQTVEAEVRGLLPSEGVGFYCAHIHSDVEVTPAMLERLAGDLPATAELLPPGIAFDVVGFACTSGAIVIGEKEVARVIRSASGTVQVTDPVTAMLAAARALGAKRFGLITPYVQAVNETLKASLEQRGLDITAFGSFEEGDDNVVARITQQAVKSAVVELGAKCDCEAVFVACTSLRAASIVAEAEAAIGKLVTSSNHALAWHMLRLAGIHDVVPGRGRLFAACLAGPE